MSSEHDRTNDKPWDQQEGEPDLWYGRFVKFMRLGTRRSIRSVFLKENKQKQAKTSTNVGPEWCNAAKQWNWEERARAYDKYQRDEEDKIIAEERDKVLRSGFALMHKRVKELDRLVDEFKKMARDKNNIWIPETKTIVGENETTHINKVVFNHQLFQLIDKYLDSIAKELGERVKKQEIDVTNTNDQDIQELHKAIAEALDQYPEAKIALAERIANHEPD